MAKKPKLKLVGQTARNPSSPPGDLKQTGASLWRSIVAEYDISDTGGRETLYQICAAADRAAECRSHIDHDGAVVDTRQGTTKEHPLLKMELASRSFVVRGLARLGILDQAVKPNGRPSSFSGWTGTDDD